MVGSRLTSRK